MQWVAMVCFLLCAGMLYAVGGHGVFPIVCRNAVCSGWPWCVSYCVQECCMQWVAMMVTST